jgi:methylenetetrahydrofolate reductase (NADPH)
MGRRDGGAIERCLAAGITAPIVPGIMPVSNYAQAAKFSAMCGTSISGWLGHIFDGTEDDPEIRRMVATVVAAGRHYGSPIALRHGC